ncbi:hypothetical protein XBJ1_1887 [Xenorhabdus bovienii SS-2004]|uniref:Uncharacterized protein n=1 Tax=Xenorhabdus bovienii (strain SS-2004) TaxID=406818 RepID=D3V2P8_XENBS|nr:hypothetical protein XBJ1_1887 [Xenorhabdus bovienii SS-2004]
MPSVNTGGIFVSAFHRAPQRNSNVEPLFRNEPLRNQLKLMLLYIQRLTHQTGRLAEWVKNQLQKNTLVWLLVHSRTSSLGLLGQ